jgi:hypothetical protein
MHRQRRLAVKLLRLLGRGERLARNVGLCVGVGFSGALLCLLARSLGRLSGSRIVGPLACATRREQRVEVVDVGQRAPDCRVKPAVKAVKFGVQGREFKLGVGKL